ncbi:[FeFe] hydrogenase H-cluster radical SAM maturase HydG [Candidatus Saganbacteria bacterium]|nr:[FeFe] hydrogenase H-cluster radical SAM maturase HydG [Candidatus Saganbacteria bacterium]
MKYIDEKRIGTLLNAASSAGADKIDGILSKSKSLQRLTLSESAILLAEKNSSQIKKILDAAHYVKDKIYGKRVVIFAPLYISNLCKNNCLYCSFRSDNSKIDRKALTTDEIKEQVAYLLSRGHKRILAVAGEAAPKGKSNIDFYVESIEAIYSVKQSGNSIRRVNINCAPLNIEEFKKLKSAGIGTFQLFQETYHEGTYKKVHPSGPKSDPENRLDAIERAIKAGIDDVGIGVLYGLYDHKFETLAILCHIEALEKKFNFGPHTISVPRIEPAIGSDFSVNVPYKVLDDDFKKIVAVLRLSVPYTGIILSTRETASLRDELFSLGISQISAESKTSPGGYSDSEEKNTQFSTNDKRCLDEVMGSLLEKGFIPSFCAACYRKERTGKKFMSLAKPGLIAHQCSINALVTLKEYLDDFASDNVRREGYKLIDKQKEGLDDKSLKQLSEIFSRIDSGKRDEYI